MMVCSDGKASRAAKAMKKDVIVEVTGKLRHDHWKDRATNRWTGKVFIAVDPGEGSVRSMRFAESDERAEAHGRRRGALGGAFTAWDRLDAVSKAHR